MQDSSNQTDTRTIMDKIKQEITPSLISGGIAVIASNMLLGVDLSSRYPLLGYNIPSWLAIGGVVGGSVLISEISHDWILERIPSIQSFATYENRILAPLLAGVGTYALFKLTVSNDVEIINSVLLGSASAVGGSYISDTIFKMY